MEHTPSDIQPKIYEMFHLQDCITYIRVFEHPLPCPALTGLESCDFYPFLKVKRALKGTHFQSVDEEKMKMADLLNRMSADGLQCCFEQWRICMAVNSQSRLATRNKKLEKCVDYSPLQ
jgi:hypothetical protein